MKFIRNLNIVVLSVTFVAFGLTPAFAESDTSTLNNANPSAQPVEGRSSQWKHQHRENGFSQLGLSEEQKNKLKAMHKNFREQNAQTFEDLKAKHEQLKTLKESGKGDSPEAKALREALIKERKEMRQKNEELMQSILTPDQLQKWQATKTQWKASRGHHQKNDANE